MKFTLGLEFPNLPYFVDGDFKLTETMAIHSYIADKWKPELLGKDAQHRGHISMLSNKCIEFKMAVTMPCYMTGDAAEVTTACQKHLPALLDYMGTNAYLTGNQPSYVDFYFFEAIQFPIHLSNGALLTEFPKLAKFNDSMKTLLGQAYCDSCLDKDRPFNNKVAKLNGEMAL